MHKISEPVTPKITTPAEPSPTYGYYRPTKYGYIITEDGIFQIRICTTSEDVQWWINISLRQININIQSQYQIHNNTAINPRIHVSKIIPFVPPPNVNVQVFIIEFHKNYLDNTCSTFMQITFIVLMERRMP